MSIEGLVLYNDKDGKPATSSELRFDDSTQYPDSRLNTVNLTITEDVHVAGKVGAATANPRQNLEVTGYTLLVGQGSSSQNPYQFGLNGEFDTLSLMSRNGIGTGGAMSIFFGLQSIINYPVARIVAADERGLPTLTFQTGRGSAFVDRIKIDIDGNTNINGSLIMNGNVVFKVDTWNTSTDGRYRLYLGNNSTTFFGSPNGYEFQNSGNVRIAYLDDGGNFSPTGYINFRANLWNVSSDNKNRLFFSYNDRTFFGSQNGYSFRGANDTDIASIDNVGNLYANASLTTGGYIYATANITTMGSLTAYAGLNISGDANISGIITGDGSGLINIPTSIKKFFYNMDNQYYATFPNSLPYVDGIYVYLFQGVFDNPGAACSICYFRVCNFANGYIARGFFNQTDLVNGGQHFVWRVNEGLNGASLDFNYRTAPLGMYTLTYSKIA